MGRVQEIAQQDGVLRLRLAGDAGWVGAKTIKDI